MFAAYMNTLLVTTSPAQISAACLLLPPTGLHDVYPRNNDGEAGIAAAVREGVLRTLVQRCSCPFGVSD